MPAHQGQPQPVDQEGGRAIVHPHQSTVKITAQLSRQHFVMSHDNFPFSEAWEDTDSSAPGGVQEVMTEPVHSTHTDKHQKKQ